MMNLQSDHLTLTLSQWMLLYIAAFTMPESLTCLYVVLILFGEQLDLEFAHAAI